MGQSSRSCFCIDYGVVENAPFLPTLPRYANRGLINGNLLFFHGLLFISLILFGCVFRVG